MLHFLLTGAASGLLLAGIAIPASAGPAGIPALANATRVEDADLAEMRGKFISPDSVSFFGITMVTSWQDQSGITTLARLVFNVDFLAGGNGQPVPQLLFGWSREGDPAMDVTQSHAGYVATGADQVLPMGGLEGMNGAAQVHLIAGADNSALNDFHIAIVPASVVSTLTGAGLQPADGTTSLNFSDGDQLQFRMAGNQIGMVMTGNNGLDSSMQMIGGDIGQALQQTILNSDQNNIASSASIIFGIDALTSLNTMNPQEALSVMKGHGY